MARINSENKVPQIGVVLPTKEVSAVSPDRDTQSDIEKFIRTLPDYERFFYVVYHHTILNTEMVTHEEPVQGETRYKNITPFPDPISLLSLLSKVTTHSELYTAVMVAPQMQTAFLAQQVAAIANESNGRFRLGVGVGWNKSEYEALGVGDRFHRRGKILNLQIPTLKDLLAGKSVNITIHKEKMEGMAINPASNYNVPFWVGGLSKAAIKRAAEHDVEGWMPLGDVGPFVEKKELLLDSLRENGKDPEQFKTMGRIALGKMDSSEWVDNFLDWQEAGATHLALTTTVEEDNEEGKNSDPSHHLELLSRFMRATSWIRTPRGSFSSLFSKYGAGGASDEVIEEILGEETESEFFLFDLIKEIKSEHLVMYLEDIGFRKINIKKPRNITTLSEKSLLLSFCMVNEEGHKVYFLEEENMGKTRMVVYDKKIELGFMSRD